MLKVIGTFQRIFSGAVCVGRCVCVSVLVGVFVCVCVCVCRVVCVCVCRAERVRAVR